MSEESKVLVAKRGRIKATLTRISNYVDNFDPQNHQLADLSARLEVFNQLWPQYDQVQDQILAENQEDNDAESFEEQFFKTKGKFFKFFEQPKQNSDPLESKTFGNQGPGNQERDQAYFQLEKMKLPEFDGSYSKWLNFRDTFRSLVHEPQSIPTIFKFHRLRSLLQGEPFDLLQSLDVTIENYQKAWELLCSRYDNTKIIIQTHISTLFNLPKVESSYSKSLRTLTLELNKTIQSLKSLGQPTDQWDAIIIHLACSKLDKMSLRAWEEHSVNFKDFDYSKLDSFLKNRCTSLEAVEAQFTPDNKQNTNSNSKSKQNTPGYKSQQKSNNSDQKTCMLSNSNPKFQCHFCKDSAHAIFQCTLFKQLPIDSKWQKIKELNLCSVCLRENHADPNSCKLKSGCRTCGRAHNSILHFEGDGTFSSPRPSTNGATPTHSTTQPGQSPTLHSTCNATFNPSSAQGHSTLQLPSAVSLVSNSTNSSKEILLPTAVVSLLDQNNVPHRIRVILDSASQLNFVSQSIANFLSLPKTSSHIQILGVNNAHTNTTETISTIVKSPLDDSFKLNLEFHVIPQISQHPVPFHSLDQSKLDIPNDVRANLADPNFSTSLPVDGLLGAQAFFDLFSTGNFTFFKVNQMYFCKSILGWVVSGTIPQDVKITQLNQCLLSIFDSARPDPINYDFSDEIEEQPPKFRSKDENFCENHFQKTHYRDDTGRFVVSLPLKADPKILGDSFRHAEGSFLSLERKFAKNPDLKTQYSDFMKEYEDLSHMSLIPPSQIDNHPSYYLPHHPVFKNSSTSSIRVVFNASSKSTSGHSLNDLMYAVQPRQDSLYSIMLRFRMYKFCISADVAKMYRQVNLNSAFWDLQRIIWRENPNDPLKHYHLTTVTYGEGASPQLATRCLLELAYTNHEQFTIASQVIERDFFVDDCITGTDTLEEAKLIQSQVSSILASAGMPLRKWCSNEPSILTAITPDGDPHHVMHITDDKESVSALGLCWTPFSDHLSFRSRISFHSSPYTKRSIVSDLSKIFDPMGLITPILIKGKIFVQELWQCKANWDDVLSTEIQQKWSGFSAQLVDLNSLQVPRPASLSSTQFELHGFSDSSQSAYGACIYVKSWDDDDNSQVRLLTSKSRVSPLKTISIPRLELNAAVLLVRLMTSVVSSLRSQPTKVTYWSDSSIVLAWISGEPCQFKTYVGNRITEIHSTTDRSQWLHVGTKSNPADLVSRGLTPKEIYDNLLWWHGPQWLLLSSAEWPISQPRSPDSNELEVKPIKFSLLHTTQTSFIGELLQKYSSWKKLVSVVAHVLRYVRNLRTKAQKLDSIHDIPRLRVVERRNSAYAILRTVQQLAFPTEVDTLSKGLPLKPKNKLLPLSPFFHKETQLILVGGRLSSAEFSYFKKHPILLPADHFITRLILIYYHETHLHIGAHSLIAIVRNRYWPLNGKNIARNVIRKCVICVKAKPEAHNQMMADLPKVRVTPARPFLATGIDFCGPFYLKAEFRKNVKYKAYVSVFVCLVTRAIHLELVTDLTTNAFLAAFRRFISRRGLCKDVYTDNGSNFTGADKELKSLFKKVKTQGDLQEFAAEHEIQWHFIPPSAPHFGGIWEAAVKSAKYHLLRTIGYASVTYEEFSTFLCQVEACLNSRPLHPSSADPNDCSALTPGHFLIGGPLTLPLDDDYSHVPDNRLKRWTFLQARLQEFWKKWSSDYLNTQQHRPKWLTPRANLTVGTLVIIKEENLPPLKWRLGRVSQVHPGKDNLVRSATVTLSDKTTLKRPVEKLCPLPLDEED